jgi:hypothetical protein
VDDAVGTIERIVERADAMTARGFEVGTALGPRGPEVDSGDRNASDDLTRLAKERR